jgi:hypothetical protein
MKINKEYKIILFATLLLFGVVWTSGGVFSHQVSSRFSLIPVVSAETEDDGNEFDDGGVPAVSSTDTTSSVKVKSTPTYKKVLVTKVITTLDPQFKTDQDKDGIVDGLDPHPTVSETEFFTDDDNDGVANAFDKHPKEDDYAYFEQDQDANGNGVLDSYEAFASN